jgi:outer membrane receptor protein involved in Fe transport
MAAELSGSGPSSEERLKVLRFGGNDYNVGIAALFGQVSGEPTRRIRLTAGGRHDRLELDNMLTFRDGNPVVEDTFDAFSPKVSGTFKLLPDVAGADVNLYRQ